MILRTVLCLSAACAALASAPVPAKPGLPGVTPTMKAGSPDAAELGKLREKLMSFYCTESTSTESACKVHAFLTEVRKLKDPEARKQKLLARKEEVNKRTPEEKAMFGRSMRNSYIKVPRLHTRPQPRPASHES